MSTTRKDQTGMNILPCEFSRRWEPMGHVANKKINYTHEQ